MSLEHLIYMSGQKNSRTDIVISFWHRYPIDVAAGVSGGHRNSISFGGCLLQTENEKQWSSGPMFQCSVSSIDGDASKKKYKDVCAPKVW